MNNNDELDRANAEKEEKDAIIAEILQELQWAECRHPGWVKDIFCGLSIISEELGEKHQAALDYVYSGGEKSEIRNELIQTAAMCLRMLFNYN